ncbi:TSUP family transporter [Peptostreptococcus faecalis]|uniref:TSUP family transporter n=1 Tax=Peptostreptococcus faecalis TaxID=2045015 RepID=UPI0015E101D2|nr:TSUP family transporter [Peptostreptococcus faecalis]
MIIKILQILLYVAFIGFAFVFIKDLLKAKKENTFEDEKIWKPAVTGFVTNFFDTLGIGSFAPSMFFFKAFRHNLRDKQIPGTLNVADALPVMLEAILFIGATNVDSVTLVSLIGAAVVGSYVGAGIMSKIKERTVQIVMGVALLISAILFLASVMKWIPLGGTALGLSGVKLVAGIVIFLGLGMLMTAGVGLYAPAMVVVYAMGMDPMAAFPIMMGSCALLMPVASAKFIKENAYAKKNAAIIAISGIIGVGCAFPFVSSLDIEKLKILVIVVVLATAFMMLKAAFTNKEENSI